MTTLGSRKDVVFGLPIVLICLYIHLLTHCPDPLGWEPLIMQCQNILVLQP